MPQYSFQHPFTVPNPQEGFKKEGPCSAVEIHVPDALVSQLQNAGQPTPIPVAGKALIDTGASISAIDETHAIALGLAPMATAQISTPHGTKIQNVYGVKLEFPGTLLPPVPFLMVAGSELLNQQIDVLLGRDYLSDKVLIYNGPMLLCTVCF